MVNARIVASDSDPGRTRAVADASVELLGRAPFAVVVLDAALVVTGWNEAAASCFGVAADAAIGRPLGEFLLAEAELAGLRGTLEGGEPSVTLACVRPGEGPLRCTWQVQAIAGETASWICIVQPVARLSLDERVLTAVLDNLPISIWVVDRRGDYVFHDGLGVTQIGVQRRSWVGLNLWKLWGDNEGTAETLRQVQAAMDANQKTHAYADAMGMTWETWCVPLLDEAGVPEGVLTVPLMGSVDGDRTSELMERMLAEVVRKRARHAILDLTGVEVVDARTAAYIIDLVRAIRLLGAEALLTGIRPSVAQIFVEVGADLSQVPTRSNLRSGLEYCMQRLRRGATRTGA